MGPKLTQLISLPSVYLLLSSALTTAKFLLKKTFLQRIQRIVSRYIEIYLTVVVFIVIVSLGEYPIKSYYEFLWSTSNFSFNFNIWVANICVFSWIYICNLIVFLQYQPFCKNFFLNYFLRPLLVVMFLKYITQFNEIRWQPPCF